MTLSFLEKKLEFLKNKKKHFGIWWDPSDLVEEFFPFYFDKNLVTIRFYDGLILYGQVKVTSGSKPYFFLFHQKEKTDNPITRRIDSKCEIIDTMQLRENLPEYKDVKKSNIINVKK